MPYLNAESGIDWHYDVSGEGKTLLFIHGWGVDRRIWRQQIKYFSKKFCVVNIDLPGHGKSSWKLGISLEENVRDINHILNQCHIDSLSIIASSLGGLVALKFYDMFPEKVHKVAMIGSGPKFTKSSDYPYGLWGEQIYKLRQQLQTGYPSIVNIFFRSLFSPEERKTRRFKWIQRFRQDDSVPGVEALNEYLGILEKEDLRDVLKKGNIAWHFMYGSDDNICSPKVYPYLKQLSSNTKFFSFDQSGHYPFLTKPHEFNSELEKFLA